MAEIPLTFGYTALVDDNDLAEIAVYKWCAHRKRNGKIYARASINGTQVSLHRFVMGIKDGSVHIDHISGDGLDNRKCNLRACTPAQNRCNSGARGGTSTYKGVYYEPRVNKWRGQIKFQNKKYDLGFFTSDKDAALAYDEKAKTLHGEFAKLNFR